MDSGPRKFSPTYHAIRIALGIVYFHFGMLKFFPDLSPAELLASQTIMRLTDGSFDAFTALQVLAVMECLLGVLLIFNIAMRATLILFLFHMIGTFTPLFVLPELTFKIAPFAPTMEGQYILKNLVFVAAGFAMVPELYFSRGHRRTACTPDCQSPCGRTCNRPVTIGPATGPCQANPGRHRGGFNRLPADKHRVFAGISLSTTSTGSVCLCQNKPTFIRKFLSIGFLACNPPSSG